MVRRIRAIYVAGAMAALAPLTAQAETCALEVVDSVDAVRAELSYYRDSDSLQALLITQHRYDDNSTMITVIPLLCENLSPGVCTATVIETFDGDTSFWRTELTRDGDQVTATHTGANDVNLTDLIADGRYVDEFRVAECDGEAPLEVK